jgi:hypothetical protein
MTNNSESTWLENALSVEVRGRVHAKKLCHKCDAKPVFTAQTDFFDRSHLLILRKLLKTQMCSKIPAYRLRPPFSITYRRSYVCLTELSNSKPWA